MPDAAIETKGHQDFGRPRGCLRRWEAFASPTKCKWKRSYVSNAEAEEQQYLRSLPGRVQLLPGIYPGSLQLLCPLLYFCKLLLLALQRCPA